MIKLTFSFSLFLSCVLLFGQRVPLKPLEAHGQIPTDFTNYTIEKINAREHNHSEEFLSLSKKHQKNFLKAVHQGIDEILHSGKVLYGDTLTQYVNALGKKLFGDDESLKHIRFYTLKTNVVNAFSTNQGIIFVSQGLLAQVKNEAQLAFVLAHELAHYTERHVIVGYRENMELMTSRRSISEKIKRYSIYSKDKEYEADRIGVKLYNKAGYNLNDLYSVFDLLSFSYLPFESKVVRPDYFNSNLLFLPTSFFKKDLPKVDPDDEVDDSKSTHPNIKSRKDQLTGEIPKYKKWEDKLTLTSQSEFEYARSVARMEQIRNDLYDFEYISALYNVYLLEDELNDNLHFNQYKAQTWLGLLIFKTYSRFSDIAAALTLIQGEQHQMHHVIRALNRRQLSTLAIRNIYDLKKRFPEDAQIQQVYESAIRYVAEDEKFKLKDFYNITYTEALERFGPGVQTREKTNNEMDYTNSQLAIERAKYGINNEGKIDDNDFYRFGLSDVVRDEEFVKMLEGAQKKRKKPETESKEKTQESKLKKLKNRRKGAFMNSKESRKNERNKMRSNVNRVILFEPRCFASRNGNTDVVESEKLELKIKDAFENLQVDFMQVVKIGSKELKDADAELYNEKGVLMNTLMQLLEYQDVQLFPVDYNEIQQMRDKYKTDKVVFLILENDRYPWKTKLATISIFTSFPAIAISAQKSADNFTLSMFLFDLKTYSMDGVLRYQINGKPSVPAIEALCYNMLHILYTPKKTTEND